MTSAPSKCKTQEGARYSLASKACGNRKIQNVDLVYEPVKAYVANDSAWGMGSSRHPETGVRGIEFGLKTLSGPG